MKLINLSINTAEGQSSLNIGKLKGCLNSIIIDAPEKIEVIIESQNGYPFLARRDVKGINYYCPRVRTTTAIESLFDKSEYEEYYLDEEMIITIMGPKNIEVKFEIRIKPE
jgi:hypothetical protein